MSDEQQAKLATPCEELRRQIMDSNIPKNEREWWAAREIEKLEEQLAAMTKRVEEAERDVGRFRYRINLADACILWLTAGSTKEYDRGFELARQYMADYGDSPDNSIIDKALPTTDLLQTRGKNG